jgi:hypothetical protein
MSRKTGVQGTAGATTSFGGTNKPVSLQDLYPEPNRQATQKEPSSSLPMQQEGTRRGSNLGAWPLVVSARCPSSGASDTRGRPSKTEANHSTCSSRRRGTAKRATTRRDNQELKTAFQNTGGAPFRKNLCNKKGDITLTMNY